MSCLLVPGVSYLGYIRTTIIEHAGKPRHPQTYRLRHTSTRKGSVGNNRVKLYSASAPRLTVPPCSSTTRKNDPLFLHGPHAPHNSGPTSEPHVNHKVMIIETVSQFNQSQARSAVLYTSRVTHCRRTPTIETWHNVSGED